jgi:translation initiation factor 2 subunit 2
MDYEKMLEKGRKELPESILKTERFEIPKVKGHIQGNRTVINNFNEIAKILHREPEHLLKFVLKELAAPGEIKKTGVAMIGRKVSAASINEKIEKYAKEFVLCHECKKPDTQLFKKENVVFIRCLACGAQHPVKDIK